MLDKDSPDLSVRKQCKILEITRSNFYYKPREFGFIHNNEFSITLTTFISLASRVYEIFESSKIAEKRQLINFMFSNLRMNGEKLRFNLKKPFHLMADLISHYEWLGWQDSNLRMTGSKPVALPLGHIPIKIRKSEYLQKIMKIQGQK
jgi:hypothetical protein